ncbi:MAG: alpha/beta hydrolase [Ferruginibacter sp.]
MLVNLFTAAKHPAGIILRIQRIKSTSIHNCSKWDCFTTNFFEVNLLSKSIRIYIGIAVIHVSLIKNFLTNKNFLKKTISIVSFTISSILLLPGCAFKRVNRSKNIIYLQADAGKQNAAQKLNVFAPYHNDSLKDVLIFLYGGSWNSGRRGLYSFFGNRMARKNVVTVIIDYPKSPTAGYDEMATDAAIAVKWVKENILQYGGDPNKIFVSGHSAGGHLATLITVRNSYFEKLGITNPIKGAVLIDAAGLDMYGYLKEEDFPEDNTYIKTFTNDPANWKLASPLYNLHNGIAPMLIYQGERTYPSIKAGNENFLSALKNLGYTPSFHLLKGKKHVAMITQFFNSGNKRYKEIIEFMEKVK